MKYIKTYEAKKEIKKISTLSETLFNFLKQLTDILPENYTVKTNANHITITQISIGKNGKNKRDVTGIFVIDKFTFDRYTQNQYEFKILIRCTPSLNPYIIDIANYIIDNIKNYEYTTEEHKFNKFMGKLEEDYYIYFNEKYYDEIIDNINKLSIKDLYLRITQNKYNF
jgi:hypothetical protein